MIIAFSGIDGSGKSTQVKTVVRYLHSCGYSTYQIHMIEWSLSNKIGRLLNLGHDNQELPSDRVARSQPHALESLGRQSVSLFDLFRFRLLTLYHVKFRRRIVICDRYFFDIAVHGVYRQFMSSAFESLYRRLAPRSTLAILLDVSANLAEEREQSHCLDYYEQKRRLYLQYADKWGALIIPSGSLSNIRGILIELIKPLLVPEVTDLHVFKARE